MNMRSHGANRLNPAKRLVLVAALLLAVLLAQAPHSVTLAQGDGTEVEPQQQTQPQAENDDNDFPWGLLGLLGLGGLAGLRRREEHSVVAVDRTSTARH
jgi:MYXO-CTERM domain-containing protein